jgi:Tol biopolymer transport system component
MDRDGRNVRQRSDGPQGAWNPRFAADGRLVYLSYRDPLGKRRRADLVIDDGKERTVAVDNTVFSDYALSPDGKAVAFCKPGALVFHDVPSGKEQEVALTAIDERLADHAAVKFSWSPDGRAVACEMIFWGGRQQGTKMFGDDLVFIIPRAGKPTWFGPGEPFLDLQWVRENPDASPPGQGLIRIDANAQAKTVVVRPDGTGRTEAPSPVPLGQVASPDTIPTPAPMSAPAMPATT